MSENSSKAADHVPSLSSLTMILKVEYSHLSKEDRNIEWMGKLKENVMWTSIGKHLTASVTSAVQFLRIHQAVPPQSGNYSHRHAHMPLRALSLTFNLEIFNIGSIIYSPHFQSLILPSTA